MHLLTPSENRRLNELVGFIGLTISILLLLSLVSYHSLDASWNVAAPGTEHLARNWIGLVGAFLADLLYQVFGYAALLVPLGVFIVALRWLRNQRASAPGVKLAGSVVMLVAIDALLTMTPLYPLAGQLDPGGLVGTLAARVLRHLSTPWAPRWSLWQAFLWGCFWPRSFRFRLSRGSSGACGRKRCWSALPRPIASGVTRAAAPPKRANCNGSASRDARQHLCRSLRPRPPPPLLPPLNRARLRRSPSWSLHRRDREPPELPPQRARASPRWPQAIGCRRPVCCAFQNDPTSSTKTNSRITPVPSNKNCRSSK